MATEWERTTLESYISNQQPSSHAHWKGIKVETLSKPNQESQFVLLPSNSEGWPKATAEGMFWGCIPMANRRFLCSLYVRL
jgi:hypothetical protein